MVFRYFRTKPPWPSEAGELALCEAPGLMLHPGLLRSKRTFGIDADLPLCTTQSVRRVSGLLETGFGEVSDYSSEVGLSTLIGVAPSV